MSALLRLASWLEIAGSDLRHPPAIGAPPHAPNGTQPSLRSSVADAIQQHASRTAAVLDEVGRRLPLAGQARAAAGNARDEQHQQDERVKQRVIAGVLAVLSTHRGPGHPTHMIADGEISRLWEAAAAQVPLEAARWGPIVIESPYAVVRAAFADV